ncbi:hypothetical protein C8J57DRAFT_1493268 [Mycena rebaudengoi]|nr:hypothetical protein C8J57DRAFT_1493268 [Mycena rebaudengoi]
MTSTPKHPDPEIVDSLPRNYGSSSEAAPDIVAPVVSAIVLTPALASLVPIAVVRGVLILVAPPVPVTFSVAVPAANTANIGPSVTSSIPSALSSASTTWHTNLYMMVPVSTSSTPSTNLGASAATWHPSSMPTFVSSATTSVFPILPLPYSDNVF